MPEKSKPVLRCTRDYAMFVHSSHNRPTDLSNRKALQKSMEEHGFLPCYPIFCKRTRGEKMEIWDGQHRYAMAQKLGLPVWYVILDADVSIPDLNGTQKVWNATAYAQCFAAQGNQNYIDLLDFHKRHGMPIAIACAIMSGTIDFSNRRSVFLSGDFVVKNRLFAERVALVYARIRELSRHINAARLLEALYAVCLIPELELERIVEGARRCPEKLIAYGTRDAYLTLLEDLYNFGRRTRVSIKIPAENAVRERNAVHPRKAD